MRKLASIRKVSDIKPIDGKDRIVLAFVDGWSVIVKKDEFKIGDKVIFCEIDSVLPPKDEFEFLKKNNYRIKTMKMSGVLSQGICFPLSMIPDGKYNVDDDVTELMGITQYEKTMDKEIATKEFENKKYNHPFFTKFLFKSKFFRKLLLPKKQNKGFPSFISKTDETRIQNASFYLEMDCKYIATEKVDGQSGSFVLKRRKSKNPFVKDKFEYIVCSRNLRLWNKTSQSYWKVSDKYNIEKVLHYLIQDNDWVAIQGECLDTNVQGNKYKVSEADLYVFNLIYPSGRVDSLSAKELVESQGLKFVPILEESISLKGMSVAEVLDLSNGKSKLFNTLREGIVFRTLDGKQSFKAVSPDFLIKNDE